MPSRQLTPSFWFRQGEIGVNPAAHSKTIIPSCPSTVSLQSASPGRSVGGVTRGDTVGVGESVGTAVGVTVHWRLTPAIPAQGTVGVGEGAGESVGVGVGVAVADDKDVGVGVPDGVDEDVWGVGVVVLAPPALSK